MKNNFLIGDVSRLMDTPKSTLRYYDEKKIFSPEIKGKNGYRYYSPEQFIILREIKMMRDMKLSLDEIIKILNNSDEEKILEIINKNLKKVQKEMENLKTIEKNLLKNIENYNERKNIKLCSPFIDIIDEDVKGQNISAPNIDKAGEDELIKRLKNLEKRDNKIINHLIKTSAKNLEQNAKQDFEENSDENGYVILADENQNNEIICEKGRYISVYNKGMFREKNDLKILREYAKNNNLKLKNEEIYIFFNISIFGWKKDEILYKFSVRLEEVEEQF